MQKVCYGGQVVELFGGEAADAQLGDQRRQQLVKDGLVFVLVGVEVRGEHEGDAPHSPNLPYPGLLSLLFPRWLLKGPSRHALFRWFRVRFEIYGIKLACGSNVQAHSLL